jgi:hypothetical protein
VTLPELEAAAVRLPPLTPPTLDEGDDPESDRLHALLTAPLPVPPYL